MSSSKHYSDTYASSTGRDDISVSSDAGGRRSQSVRYSYASTLHDLAVDGGGIEQANRIFLAKPWLRASIVNPSASNTNGETKKLDGFGSNFAARPPAPIRDANVNAENDVNNDNTNASTSALPVQEGYAAADIRRLSLASSPPPLGLAPPISLASESKSKPRQLRKVNKASIGDLAAGAGSQATNNSSVDEKTDQQLHRPDHTDGSGSLWGLAGWFGGSHAETAESQAKAPASSGTGGASTTLTRSTTVAQFDDAPNDDSCDADADADADGETDVEYEHEHEPVFHEGEDAKRVSDHPRPLSLLTDRDSGAETTRPESSILPSLNDEADSTAKELSTGKQTTVAALDASFATSPTTSTTSDADLNSTRTVNTTTNGSPSSNPSLPLICSTHSITSYQPTLVHLPSTRPLTASGLGLGLDTQGAIHEGQTAVIEEEEEELLSDDASHTHRLHRLSLSLNQRDSSLSLDSSSSPSKKTLKPVLAPIQTETALLAQDRDQDQTLSVTVDEAANVNSTLTSSPNQHLGSESEKTLKHHLSDPRFSNAYKLAQSIRVPTPSIRSPTRQSSINVLSTLITSPPLSPTLSITPDMQVSSRWFSQDSSEDAELMMGGSPEVAKRPLAPARTRSSTVTSPVPMTPTSPNGVSTQAQTVPLRRPSRPTLLDTRAPTLSSISELGIGSALHPSDTLNSISGGSELLSDVDTPTGLGTSGGGDLDDPLASPDLAHRRSRLAKSSLDSLPSYLRPPSISDSISTSGGRPTSSYQAYQQRHLERNRRANARVAAKMSGATPKELKQLQATQHQSMILGGNGSPNPNGLGKLETGSIMVTPEPSRAACTLFFLGFFLGPWFWIFGGWMPLGHSSEIKKDEEASLDFTGADDLPRGWKWTYHPDPWVKRNRRAAAIGIPIVLVGGIAAAVAVAVVFGSA